MTSITVGGLPGTGTSTLCKLLQGLTQLPYTYAGQLFRDAAKARGMSLAEFGALCESDATVDQALDDTQIEMLRRGRLVLEGRLSGWLAAKHNLPALKVWVVCDDDERVRRLVDRDGGDPPSQRSQMVAREASERARYHAYYGANLTDLSPYDLVLDSTHAAPASLAASVHAAWEALSKTGA